MLISLIDYWLLQECGKQNILSSNSHPYDQHIVISKRFKESIALSFKESANVTLPYQTRLVFAAHKTRHEPRWRLSFTVAREKSCSWWQCVLNFSQTFLIFRYLGILDVTLLLIGWKYFDHQLINIIFSCDRDVTHVFFLHSL